MRCASSSESYYPWTIPRYCHSAWNNINHFTHKEAKIQAEVVQNLADYLENLFNKKVDILTPEGIRSIRIEKIAQEISMSVIYV